MNINIQCCKTCGSLEVARLNWVNVNTDEIYYDKDTEIYTEWCYGFCNSETSIIDINKVKPEEI